MKDFDKEKINSLSVADLNELIRLYENTRLSLRSCGYCNDAHGHLMKSGKVIECFACGILYISGYPAPFIGKRMEFEEITDDDVKKWQAIIQNSRSNPGYAHHHQE